MLRWLLQLLFSHTHISCLLEIRPCFFIILVLKPDKVSHVDAACGIGDAVKAYTGLFYQAKVSSGETIVIADAATVSSNTTNRSPINLMNPYFYLAPSNLGILNCILL